LGRGYPLTSPDACAELSALTAAARSCAKHYREEFACEHDHFRLVGQDNFRRYVPIREVRVRVHRDDTLFEIVARIIAAKTAGCRVTVSSSPDDDHPVVHQLDSLTHSWAGAIEFVEETDHELVARIRTRQIDRLRYAAPHRVPHVVRGAAPEVQLHIADRPVLRHGRIELLWYVQEQSLCVDYHRYGNLGPRSDEARAETL
jgi:RHH-type proline utilization regulon transcriptional repressor/proline dehydrogenase/delta 1-pyrroline-5-carboxylate dehydrogenase